MGLCYDIRLYKSFAIFWGLRWHQEAGAAYMARSEFSKYGLAGWRLIIYLVFYYILYQPIHYENFYVHLRGFWHG